MVAEGFEDRLHGGNLPVGGGLLQSALLDESPVDPVALADFPLDARHLIFQREQLRHPTIRHTPSAWRQAVPVALSDRPPMVTRCQNSRHSVPSGCRQFVVGTMTP